MGRAALGRPSIWKRSVRCSHPAAQPRVCALANPPSPAPSGSDKLCTRCPQPLRVSRLQSGEKWPRGAARGCRHRDRMGAHVCMAAARSGAGRGGGGVGNRSPALPGDHGVCVCVHTCVCTLGPGPRGCWVSPESSSGCPLARSTRHFAATPAPVACPMFSAPV